MNLLERSSFFFLGVAVLPFLVFFHIFPIQNFIEHWLVAFVITAVFVRSVFSGVIVHSNSGFVLAFLFLSLAFGAAISGRSQPFSLAMFFVFGCVLFFAASVAFFYWCRLGNSAYYGRLAFFLCLGAALQGIGALLLYLGVLNSILPGLLPNPDPRMFGFIAQSNLLAVYMVLGLSAAVYISIGGVKPILSPWLFSLAVFFSFIIAGSGSRAAFLYVAVLVVSLFYLKFKLSLSWRWLLCWLGGVIFGLSLFYLVDDFIVELAVSLGFLSERHASVEFMRSGSMGFRLGEIYKSWLMIEGREFFGVGFGKYGLESQALLVSGYGESTNNFPYHGHNFIGQVLGEFGVFGIIVLCFSLFGVLYCFRVDGRIKELFLLISIVFPIMINSLIEYALWYLHFSVLLVVCVTPFLGGVVKVQASRFKAVVSFFVSVVFVMGSYYAWSAYAVCLKSIKGFKTEEEILSLRLAGEGWWFGNELRLLQTHLFRPSTADLEYQDHVTEALMNWRPYDHVMFRRLHVLILKGDTESALKLADDFRVAYPARVKQAIGFFGMEEFSQYSVAEKVLLALDDSLR